MFITKYAQRSHLVSWLRLGMKGNFSPRRAAHLILLNLSDRSSILRLTKNTAAYVQMSWAEEETLKAEPLSLMTADVYANDEINFGHADQ
jgi:hypothetical protein